MFTRLLRIFGISLALSVVVLAVYYFAPKPTTSVPQILPPIQNIIPIPKRIDLITPPAAKVLDNGGYHTFQTFNNCGPAALSMALSYYDITVSQELLGNKLRPYQNPQGDNDDKSVTLEELAAESRNYGFVPFHRPNGDIEKIKLFISYDMPVITRTWTKPNEDIGHFRVVKGYDATASVLIQDDSLQGKNLRYSYSDFNTLWKKFNYEYLVLVPKDKTAIAEAILKEDADFASSWKKAATSAEAQLADDPTDIYARFNLSVALYHTGNHQASVDAFEEVESKLPFRTLWYQIEPILAYYELGDYERVFSLTDKILANHNRAFSELYILRGNIYLKEGQKELARQEFEKAVFYNRNLESAQDALKSLN